MAGAQVLLVDNGSLVAAATLRLREIAAALAGKIGQPVAPVSLLHSSGVPADPLGGMPAEILGPALAARLAQGASDFIVVPLFFGPSGALTDFLPASVAQLRRKFPELRVRLAPPLFDPADGRLAQILTDQVRATAIAFGQGSPQRVALVDHGSPARAVTAVRDQLAGQLSIQLGPDFVVAPASMERRAGVEYDFCDPLLASLLQQPGWNSGEVIIAMQFLQPGRHAGPGGDVEKICRDAESASGRLRTRMTPLVGAHPLLVDILADRWRAGGSSEPVS
jgi:sirohydrochlorin ferrochelatase